MGPSNIGMGPPNIGMGPSNIGMGLSNISMGPANSGMVPLTLHVSCIVVCCLCTLSGNLSNEIFLYGIIYNNNNTISY